MLTQNIIEQFFLNIIAELREESVPILNDYKEDFKDYPYEDQILLEQDEKEEEYYTEDR